MTINDEIELLEPSGYVNAKYGITHSKRSQFPIGNHTKLFASVAMFQLDENNIINISRPISDYLDVNDFWIYEILFASEKDLYCEDRHGMCGSHDYYSHHHIMFTGDLKVNVILDRCVRDWIPVLQSIDKWSSISIVGLVRKIMGVIVLVQSKPYCMNERNYGNIKNIQWKWNDRINRNEINHNQWSDKIYNRNGMTE